MRNTILGCLLATSGLLCNAQQPAPVISSDYTELTDTKPIDNTAWEQMKTPVRLSWGSTDVRYDKANVPALKETRNWKGTAWKGERIQAQAVLWSAVPLTEVSATVSDLTGPYKGNLIPASAVRTALVRYVMTDELNKDGRGGCGHRPDRTEWDSSLVADVLDVIQVKDMQARTVQPVWVSIQVPETATAGTYRGTLTVQAKGLEPMTLPLELKVTGRTLPAPKDWAFHLDLWQNPYAVARYYNVPLWSQAHFDAMRPTMQQLADAGQKIITATVMNRPWGGQTEDAFGSMVTRMKKIDGSWAFDYAIFDKWVEFMMSLGIDQQINCYSLIPWKLTFQYYDQASNSLKELDTKPGEAAYTDYWYDFLVSFAKHLKEKGWWDITTIGMDERALSDMQTAIALIKKADPDYKISLAGLYHPEIEADLYDYCIPFGYDFPADVKARREKEGKISTYYTCCTEPYPNTFTFSAPAEAAWIGWHAAGGNYDGYLRWAYNSWTLDPLRDSRFRTWAAGDCYLVYPGGRSSIRMERLVEGIQDYEKIRILRDEFEKAGAKGKLNRLNKLVNRFQADALIDQPAAGMVNRAKAELNAF